MSIPPKQLIKCLYDPWSAVEITNHELLRLEFSEKWSFDDKQETAIPDNHGRSVIVGMETFHYFHSSRITTVYNDNKQNIYSQCLTQNYVEFWIPLSNQIMDKQSAFHYDALLRTHTVEQKNVL